MNMNARSPTVVQEAQATEINLSSLTTVVEHALRGQWLGDTRTLGLSSPCVALIENVSAAVSAAEVTPEVLRPLIQLARKQNAQVISASPRQRGSIIGPYEGALLQQPAGDKPLEESEAGLRFHVAPRERSRLTIQFAEGQNSWLHAVIVPNLDPGAEPAVALRYLHHNDDEEVAIRLRRSGIVLHKEIELPLQPNRPFFLSLGLIGGELHIHLNAVPVYRGTARHPTATGLILDLIGIASGPTELAVPFLALEPERPTPLGISVEDNTRLATGVVEHARRSGSKSRFHEALHAMAGFPLAYESAAIRDMVIENRNAPGAFSQVLENLLLARLPEEEHRTMVESRPLPILRVDNVSITLSSNPAAKTLTNLFRPKAKKTFNVINRVTFEAFTGDIIGIIGKNGAGKTTFLKSLVGAIPISGGRIDIAEKPILLRPGAGMQPDLTGRQNIYKTGLYMDMTMTEIRAMIDDVIRFAELEDHIDRPFKYYSDGMRARLIFSMATAMPRDILLLDELLSAGDMGFQERAMERLNHFLSHAKLVLVVQHTFDFVLTRCTKCLLLDKGVPVYFGEPRIATELYKELL